MAAKDFGWKQNKWTVELNGLKIIKEYNLTSQGTSLHYFISFKVDASDQVVFKRCWPLVLLSLLPSRRQMAKTSTEILLTMERGVGGGGHRRFKCAPCIRVTLRPRGPHNKSNTWTHTLIRPTTSRLQLLIAVMLSLIFTTNIPLVLFAKFIKAYKLQWLGKAIFSTDEVLFASLVIEIDFPSVCVFCGSLCQLFCHLSKEEIQCFSLQQCYTW